MSTRCTAHAGRRTSTGCSGSAEPSPPPPDVPAGRFVQVLAGELANFANSCVLRFDERALLEHLLLRADHRNGLIEPFSVTELAAEMGLGPSGRRTLGGHLDRLVGAGAVTWTRRPGRLEILVYPRLVHAGTKDGRRGFVQLLPSALADHAQEHGLSPTATALLVRLLLQADPATHTLRSTTPSALQELLGLGWRRLGPALAELAAAGSLMWSPGTALRVLVYGRLVRTGAADSKPPRAARSQTNRAATAPDRAASRPKARDPLDPLRAVDLQTEPKTTPPTPPLTPIGEDQGRGWGLLVRVETALTDAQRLVLREARDRAPLSHLIGELDRLLDGGWEPEALLADIAAALPNDWRSPARLLLARAKALPTTPPDPEVLRAAADGARLAAQIEAARAYARSHAAVEFLDAEEIVAMLASAYHGAALEAGVAVVAACRPGEGVKAPVGASAGTDSETPDDKPRPRRSEPSAGPVALGQLLNDLRRRAS